MINWICNFLLPIQVKAPGECFERKIKCIVRMSNWTYLWVWKFEGTEKIKEEWITRTNSFINYTYICISLDILNCFEQRASLICVFMDIKKSADNLCAKWTHFDLDSAEKSKAGDVSSLLRNAAQVHSQMWICKNLHLLLSYWTWHRIAQFSFESLK